MMVILKMKHVSHVFYHVYFVLQMKFVYLVMIKITKFYHIVYVKMDIIWMNHINVNYVLIHVLNVILIHV